MMKYKKIISCLLGTLLIIVTPVAAYAEFDVEDLQKELTEISDKLENNQQQGADILAALEAGTPVDEVLKNLNTLSSLKDMSEKLPTLDPKTGAPMTGSAGDIDLGSTESVQLMFAKLQLQLSQTAKDNAMNAMNDISRSQEAQKQCAAFIEEARRLHATARTSGMPTAMPGKMQYYFEFNAISYGKTANNMYSDKQWESPITALQQQQEKLGADTQQKMINVQTCMGQYNSYLQDAKSQINNANTTLSSSARGQSLFSTKGSAVEVAPVATSAVVGLLVGMLSMWLILRKKANRH